MAFQCSCLRDVLVPSSVSATCFYSPSLRVPSRSETSGMHSGPPETRGLSFSVSALRCPSATPSWAGAALREEMRLHGGQSRKPVSDSTGTQWWTWLLRWRALSPSSEAWGGRPPRGDGQEGRVLAAEPARSPAGPCFSYTPTFGSFLAVTSLGSVSITRENPSS